MTDHLRFAGLDPKDQSAELENIIRSQPILMTVLTNLQSMAVPDHLMAAGAIYNCVWNYLTGQPLLTAVHDIDVLYFHPDTTWDSEDRVIRACADRFKDLPLPVQIRNQARVHLWFEQKFGMPFMPLQSSSEMLGRYASRAHAVGVRLTANGAMEVIAPFGLDDLFSFRIVPNRVLDNRVLHATKGAQLKAVWPELTVVSWDA